MQNVILVIVNILAVSSNALADPTVGGNDVFEVPPMIDRSLVTSPWLYQSCTATDAPANSSGSLDLVLNEKAWISTLEFYIANPTVFTTPHSPWSRQVKYLVSQATSIAKEFIQYVAEAMPHLPKVEVPGSDWELDDAWCDETVLLLVDVATIVFLYLAVMEKVSGSKAGAALEKRLEFQERDLEELVSAVCSSIIHSWVLISFTK